MGVDSVNNGHFVAVLTDPFNRREVLDVHAEVFMHGCQKLVPLTANTRLADCYDPLHLSVRSVGVLLTLLLGRFFKALSFRDGITNSRQINVRAKALGIQYDRIGHFISPLTAESRLALLGRGHKRV